MARRERRTPRWAAIRRLTPRLITPGTPVSLIGSRRIWLSRRTTISGSTGIISTKVSSASSRSTHPLTMFAVGAAGTENSLTYNRQEFRHCVQTCSLPERKISAWPPDNTTFHRTSSHPSIGIISSSITRRWLAHLAGRLSLERLSVHLRWPFQQRTSRRLRQPDQLPKVWQFNLSAARDLAIPRFGKFTNRIVLLNIFDRTNLIRPANGIGVFQAAYGPRITVYDGVTIPLPAR